MKNLIEKIEKLKCIGLFNDDFGLGYNMGNNKVIEEVLELLNQYNIITAPKSIKLSEIIEYYKNKKNQYWLVPIKLDNGKYKIRVKYGDSFWEDYKLEIINGKISLISLNLPIIEFKWLYTLCIAGTEIVDDLECDE